MTQVPLTPTPSSGHVSPTSGVPRLPDLVGLTEAPVPDFFEWKGDKYATLKEAIDVSAKDMGVPQNLSDWMQEVIQVIAHQDVRTTYNVLNTKIDVHKKQMEEHVNDAYNTAIAGTLQQLADADILLIEQGKKITTLEKENNLLRVDLNVLNNNQANARKAIQQAHTLATGVVATNVQLQHELGKLNIEILQLRTAASQHTLQQPIPSVAVPISAQPAPATAVPQPPPPPPSQAPIFPPPAQQPTSVFPAPVWLPSLVAPSTSAPTIPPATAGTSTGSQVCIKAEPPKYGGNTKTLTFENWLQQFQIWAHMSNVTADSQLVLSAAMFLEGPPRNMVNDLCDLALAGNPLATWNTFVLRLSAIYKTVEVQKEAQDQIQAASNKSWKRISQFISAITPHIINSGFKDADIIYRISQLLSDCVRTAMAGRGSHTAPKDWRSYCNWIIEIENDVFLTQSVPKGKAHDEMDVDTIKTKKEVTPLSWEQKQWIGANKCFLCGGKCPLKNERCKTVMEKYKGKWFDPADIRKAIQDGKDKGKSTQVRVADGQETAEPSAPYTVAQIQEALQHLAQAREVEELNAAHISESGFASTL